MRRVTRIQKESRSGQGYLSHENCESPPKGTRREFSSSQILTAGTVMDAVTAGLNWIMLPRDKKATGDAIDALTDAMITLDALTDSSGAYGSVTPMSMLDAANQ